MAEVTVDNSALQLGANIKSSTIFEAAAGALRTIPAGTLVTMKTGDGTRMVLASAQDTTDIDGVLNNDLLVAADAGAVDYNVERVTGGHIDELKLVTINSLTTLDDIPSAGLKSVRIQLEKQGFVPIKRIVL